MRIKDKQRAHMWLYGYVDAHGKKQKGWNELHPESTLEKDVKEQWNKGNRGEHGEWK